MIKPLLVIDKASGKLCIQVRLDSMSRTHELPDQLASAKMSELQDYFDKVVPQMIEELRAEKKAKIKSMRKKLKG